MDFFSEKQINKNARQLLNQLPNNISKYILNGLKTGLEETIRYFENNSLISNILMLNPGSHEMLELIYVGNEMTMPIDKFFYRSLAGQALRNRLSCIISNLKILIDNNNLTVLNLGSGTARDIIGLRNKKIDAYCFDINTDAIQIGESLSSQENLHNIHFILSSMTKLPRKYYGIADITLLIGIFCSLNDRVCSIILKKIKKYLKPDSIIIVSNVTDIMLREDYFTSFLLEKIIGWNLVYKSPKRLQKIFENAGYKWKSVFFDEPWQFHAMGIGEVI